MSYKTIPAKAGPSSNPSKRRFAMPFLDSLTGLPQATSFMRAVEMAAAEAIQARQPMSVLVLDIDRFSTFNRRHGAGHGDLVLRTMARLLRVAAGGEALAGRIGHDIFASLYPRTTIAAAHERAQMLQSMIEMNISGLTEPLTASIGVAGDPGDSVWTGDDLLDLALSRCAMAKQAGGNRIHAFGADDSLLPQRMGWPAVH
jgi:diguanylate cyclase (GGDEF)-like protein